LPCRRLSLVLVLLLAVLSLFLALLSLFFDPFLALLFLALSRYSPFPSTTPPLSLSSTNPLPNPLTGDARGLKRNSFSSGLILNFESLFGKFGAKRVSKKKGETMMETQSRYNGDPQQEFQAIHSQAASSNTTALEWQILNTTSHNQKYFEKVQDNHTTMKAATTNINKTDNKKKQKFLPSAGDRKAFLVSLFGINGFERWWNSSTTLLSVFLCLFGLVRG
jgi:hypothetical protein